MKRLAGALAMAGAVALPVVLPQSAQAAVSINIAPPPLPVYAQPVIPGAGYIWTPGYWRWNPQVGDYYWVPGTWVLPPYAGALWTPGYWGWVNGAYVWRGGYWGRTVGFYGGVNYGFGYVGHGYEGGRWNGGVFQYNRTVNNINTTVVKNVNVYNKTIVHNNDTRVSFNGGQGGIQARPNQQDRVAAAQRTAPTALQRQHEQAAQRAPEQRFASNRGEPPMSASPRPGAFASHGAGPMQAGHPGGRMEGPRMEGPRGGPHEGRPGGEHPGGGEHRGGRER